MSIKINLKIFLFAVIFYLTKQIHIYALLMFFAFCHEMGHLLCGILMGLKPKALKIMPMGLSIEFEIYSKNIKSKLQTKKIWIALAGPLTNLIIMLITMIFKENINNTLYTEIIYSNILIAIFNLLPIYPLDGGRIVKEVIHIIRGSKKSVELTNYISNISMIILTFASSIAIYYYRNIAILFIVAYLWCMIFIENKRYRLKKRIYKIIENG